MKTIHLFILFFAFSFMACNGSKSDQSTNAPAAQAQVSGPNLPSVELKTLERLFKQGSAVDFIFHNHPFSMSQDDKGSIQTSLAYFSTESPGGIPAGCKPTARMMYQINGEIVDEFDVYYSANCKFFAHMKNEKPVALNKMTPAGDEFYKKVISQAMSQGQQMHGN